MDLWLRHYKISTKLRVAFWLLGGLMASCTLAVYLGLPRWLLLIGTGLALVGATLLGEAATRHIAYPLRQLAPVMERLATGELTEISDFVARYGGRDAIGVIVISLNTSLGKLRRIIGRVTKMNQHMTAMTKQVKLNGEQTEAATTQVADAMQLVAAGTVTESASLERAAEEAVHLSTQSQTLQASAQVMHQTMTRVHTSITHTAERMASLQAQSTQIEAIIQTIEEIAQQTNLLALNAAIEAARAGPQGRGFAVVADEVRKLAERASGATHEIAGIIHATQAETTAAMTAMTEGVAEVAHGTAQVATVETIATAMAERVTAVQGSITHIASISETNSAAAEEVSAATQQMTAQLTEMVGATGSIEDMAQHLYVTSRIFHWTYADDWRARGMQPSAEEPYYPVPLTSPAAEEAMDRLPVAA
ncbi:MAG: methyl-accepting chemotaxis protein [Ktedonobacterales bacterium]|nr:methyl-accepting chemotaxis protein [Ktedonobacterales bacterium]